MNLAHDHVIQQLDSVQLYIVDLRVCCIFVSMGIGVFAVKHLHPVVRESLTAESGVNDGLALPFVTLPLLLMKYPPGYAVGVWVYKTILYRVIAAGVIGACLGAVIAMGCS